MRLERVTGTHRPADVAEPDGEDLWWLPVAPTATS
jgi:hypothetical protein